MRKSLIVLVIFFVLKSVYAQEPQIVKDINTTLDINSQTFANLVTMNGKLFLNGRDEINNSELWISDKGGTRLLKDINPGPAASNPYGFSVKGNSLYFFANDGTGFDLWKSDGTQNGTTKVVDIFFTEQSGKAPSDPIILCNSKLYFITVSEHNPFMQLWSSDGTETGTFVLKDSISNYDIHLFDGGNFLYFNLGGEIYKSDGTMAGTNMIVNENAITGIGVFKGSFYYYTSDPYTGGKIWKTDGSVGATLVKTEIYIPYNKFQITADYIFFSAADSSQITNAELWVTDGTTQGTKQLKDILPGSKSSYPRAFAVMNGEVYFHASDTDFTGSLWRTDGTSSGTRIVKKWTTPIMNYDYYFTPTQMLTAENRLYFLHTDTLGAELWQSDGTGSGTYLVKDILPGPLSSFNFYPFFTVIGTDIYFVANDGSGLGYCLWRSDGTNAGTQMIRFNYLPTASAGIKNLMKVNNTLYFSTNIYESETALWKSDGTGAGTVKLKSYKSDIQLSNFTEAGNTLYFSAFNYGDSTELWKSNGAASGTVLVSKFLSGRECPYRSPCINSCGIKEMIFSNHLLYISAADSVKSNTSLFISDGSYFGTHRINKISAKGLTTMKTGIYFNGQDIQSGSELWKSDGTTIGTQMVADIAAGNASSNPSAFEVVDGILYFSADDAIHGNELWKSSGSTTGTMMVKDINITTGSASSPWGFIKFKSKIYFMANDGIHGNEIWKTDGTALGTVLVADINPGIEDGIRIHNYPNFFGAPNKLFSTAQGFYFVGNNGMDGNEIWKSDGTEQGTKMAFAVCPDEMYAPSIDVGTGSIVFFTNFSYDYGYELWVSDGSQPGTMMVTDINAGMPNSLALISPVIYMKGSLFFPADDGMHGEELWTLKPSDYSAGNDLGPEASRDEEIEFSYPKVFPNPTAGIFTVLLDKEKLLPYNINIYNSMGNKIEVQSLQISPSQVGFDMSPFINGIYYIQFEQNGNKTGRRIIKYE